MAPIQSFLIATQIFFLVCLGLGVLSMNRLARFLKIARPERWESLKFPSLEWLLYHFNSLDAEQPNLRRQKGTVKIHFGFAVIFWIANLAARFGFLDGVIG